MQTTSYGYLFIISLCFLITFSLITFAPAANNVNFPLKHVDNTLNIFGDNKVLANLYAGPSSYPRTLDGIYDTDIIDDVIDYMDTHGLNVYRMSIYYTVGDETRNAMIAYFLANCNYDLVVCRHVYNPGGSYSDTDWANAQQWTLEVCQAFSAYQSRLWVEFVNECGDSDLSTHCQTIVTAVRNAGYTAKLVANKWNQTWASMASVDDPLGKFYTGYHFYFNSWSVSGAISQMTTALNAGCLLFNTEVGADFNEAGSFSASEVQEVNDFLAWCADTEYRTIHNAVWMRYGLQNADTYTSLGLQWPDVSDPASNDTNLGVIPDDWGAYDVFGDIYYSSTVPASEPQITEYDAVVEHSVGAGSAKIGPYQEGSENTAREINLSHGIPVTPGDVIVFKAYIKMGASTLGDTLYGGRTGIDFYGASGRICGLQSSGSVGIYPNESSAGILAHYVVFGSDWTLRTIEVTVPDLIKSESTGLMVRPTAIIPWFQVWSSLYGNADGASGWFADSEIYVNPTESPPETVTITATDDANSTITPAGAVSVPYGGNQSFSWEADPGNVIDAVTVDSVAVGNTGSYTFTNCVANHTIDVTSTAGAPPAVTVAALHMARMLTGE